MTKPGRISLIAAIALLAACNSADQESESAGDPSASASSDSSAASDSTVSALASSTAAGDGGSASAVADSRADGARKLSEETDSYLFDYAYPREAGQIEPLAKLLDRRLDESRSGLMRVAAEDKAMAVDEGFPFNKHAIESEWKVVADLPGWLSLSASTYSYMGGAHGNTGFDALVWDKQGGKAFKPIELFQSTAALNKAVQPALCDALDKERSRRRGEPVQRDPDEWQSKCVPVDETTVILGASSGKAFDKIGFLFGPYVAGPYAEGTYEVTLPVTQAVMDAVMAEYRGAFALKR